MQLLTLFSFAFLLATIVNSENSLSIVKNQIENSNGVNDDEASVEDDDENNEELFVPTNQWQTIKKGQSIPSGLHVRLNLQTGQKEAKILENDEQQSQHENDNILNIKSKSKLRYTTAEIREALKSLKLDINKNEKITEKFRSIEELKKEFANLNLEIHTETEILANLLKKYNNLQSQEKINVLNEIEYLVHQYDVARDFIKLGGLQMILPDLNSTNDQLKAQIAFTLGSAMQGNPQVQIAVLENGVLQTFLRILMLDPSEKVQLRMIYAISCLVRQFPLAQKILIESGGLTVLASMFKNVNNHYIKLNVKIITLLNDLLLEQQLAVKHAVKNDKISEERLRQYNSFNLNESLVLEGFCKLIPKLLESPDTDVREKVITAMLSFHEICANQFRSSLTTLNQISSQIKDLAQEETSQELNSDSYFTSLQQNVASLISMINNVSKDEL